MSYEGEVRIFFRIFCFRRLQKESVFGKIQCYTKYLFQHMDEINKGEYNVFINSENESLDCLDVSQDLHLDKNAIASPIGYPSWARFKK